IFETRAVYPYFLCLKFHHPNILKKLWNEHADLSRVGLYYEQSRAIELPLNIALDEEGEDLAPSKVSTKDLLRVFNQGMK
ncbi:MAG: hypothetical protein KDK60_04725, partial [Chlamydiia bacterium]|nr:hypothetical protein [Chlamydiia bacterium]